MATVTYINNDEQHNKFWSYEVVGDTVHIKWGRIGGNSDEQTKSFGSTSALEKFIAGKVREKERKGYKQVTEQKLKEETKTAEALGAQNKISRMLWVNRKGNLLTQLDKYDPKQYVYVEILNSWSKEVTRMLLGKEDSWMLDAGIAESGRTLTVNGMTKLDAGHNFAQTVRGILKKMAEVVKEALKTIKFAAVGARSLFDDDANEVPSPTLKMALANVDSSGFDTKVISKFAAMGARALEL